MDGLCSAFGHVSVWGVVMQAVRVLFLCLGNICRSPLAEGVFRDAYGGDGSPFDVDSAGTAAWHVGKSPDPGSVAVARKYGVDLSAQRARQLVAADFDSFDFIVAMDASNVQNARRVVAPRDGQLVRLRDFDPAPGDGDVPDPYGGGGEHFEEVYTIVKRSLPGLVEYMQATTRG